MINEHIEIKWNVSLVVSGGISLYLAFFATQFGCDTDDDVDEGSQNACLYEIKTDMYCDWGISYGDWRDSCMPVDSKDDCDEFTKDDTYNGGSCVDETRYQNVRYQTVKCPTPSEESFAGLGEQCFVNSDCESEICIIFDGDSSGFCTDLCTSDTNCDYAGSGTSECVELSSGRQACIIHCITSSDCLSGLICKEFSDGKFCVGE